MLTPHFSCVACNVLPVMAAAVPPCVCPANGVVVAYAVMICINVLVIGAVIRAYTGSAGSVMMAAASQRARRAHGRQKQSANNKFFHHK